jgi:hypothetical protein
MRVGLHMRVRQESYKSVTQGITEAAGVLQKCRIQRYGGCRSVTKVSHVTSQRLQELYKSVTRNVTEAAVVLQKCHT